MRPDTTRAAALLALALALPGCGDALEGSWKAELTCCDIKGTGFEGYFCGPNSPFKAQCGWSDTYNITFWGGRFELERRRGTQTPVGEHGFYIYDEAGGTLELRTCDGHDCGGLLKALEWARAAEGAPRAIVAATVKGRGVSFMEGDHAWHGKRIGDEEYAIAARELSSEGS